MYFLSVKHEPQNIQLVEPLRTLHSQLRGEPGFKEKIDKIRKTMQFKIIISNEGGEVNKEYAIDKAAVFAVCDLPEICTIFILGSQLPNNPLLPLRNAWSCVYWHAEETSPHSFVNVVSSSYLFIDFWSAYSRKNTFLHRKENWMFIQDGTVIWKIWSIYTL